MKATYDKNKMFKPVKCDYCGDVVCYVWHDKETEPEIIAVHNRKKGNCLKKAINEITPQIMVGGIDKAEEKIDEQVDAEE